MRAGAAGLLPSPEREGGNVATASFDVAVIGAGAVGMACAAELARDGRDVVVLERHARAATETSSSCVKSIPNLRVSRWRTSLT